MLRPVSSSARRPTSAAPARLMKQTVHSASKITRPSGSVSSAVISSSGPRPATASSPTLPPRRRWASTPLRDGAKGYASTMRTPSSPVGRDAASGGLDLYLIAEICRARLDDRQRVLAGAGPPLSTTTGRGSPTGRREGAGVGSASAAVGCLRRPQGGY